MHKGFWDGNVRGKKRSLGKPKHRWNDMKMDMHEI